MRPVSGFLADDGTYFDTYEDAELHDSIHALSFVAETRGIDPVRLMTALDLCANEIRRYLYAKDNQVKSDTNEPSTTNSGDNPTTLGVDHPDDTRSDASSASILEQSPNCDEPVSNLGRRLLTEAIHDFGPVDGVRSWRSDASSLHSDTNMAIVHEAGTTQARNEGS